MVCGVPFNFLFEKRGQGSINFDTFKVLKNMMAGCSNLVTVQTIGSEDFMDDFLKSEIK